MKLKRKPLAIILLASLLATSLPVMAQDGESSFGYTEPYVISPRFSIKPSFNTGEGDTVVSPRFSIKPAFNSGTQRAFYSGVFSILDMPDLVVTVDDVPLEEGVKVKDTSKLHMSMDFSQSLNKDDIDKVEWFYEVVTTIQDADGNGIEDVTRSELTQLDMTEYNTTYVVGTDLDLLQLTTGVTYKIGQLTTLKDGLVYESVSIPFVVNQKGLIEFLSPTGTILYEEYITVTYEISNKLVLNTYNLYIEKSDGSRVLVGEKLKFADTKTGDTVDGTGTLHLYKYELPDDVKEFQHIITKID